MRQRLFLILIAAGLSVPAYSITDQERTILHRLYTELDAVTKIIDETQHAANPNHRRQVDYQVLREDLEEVQQGILDAVNAERREPRSLPPLEGQYH